jgi:hypothetical protein
VLPGKPARFGTELYMIDLPYTHVCEISYQNLVIDDGSYIASIYSTSSDHYWFTASFTRHVPR